MKPIKFTLQQTSVGWKSTELKPSNFEKVLYLGKCLEHGDLFVVYYKSNIINIYKGHLNDGVIE